MGNSKSAGAKLKIIWLLLTHPQYRNMLAVNCDFCGSMNVITKKQRIESKDSEHKIYEAEYLCMSCKASCRCTQEWHHYSKETINKIKDQIKQ